jgi:opacity protein-like surface antigen
VKQQLFGLFFGSILSATVSAAGGAINPVLNDPFTFKLGADFLKADGTFSSTIAGDRTVKISTSDLGVDDSNATPYFGFRWRFADRWRLTFDYIGGDTDGGVRKDFDDLEFGDINASGFLAVDTKFDTDFYIVQAGYSFLKNERAELGIGGGFHVVRFETKLKVSGGIDGFGGGSVRSDSVELTAPLPNILGFGTYAITPKLSLDGNVGWFSLGYNDYSGNLVALNANLEYRVTKHFGVGIGYNYVDMDLTIDKSKRKDKYDLDYQGPVVYVSAGF